MKKFNLNLDELKVDSFTINSDSKSGKGTVKGLASPSADCFETEGQECSYQAGCNSYDCWISDTCNRMECYGTVDISCDCPYNISVKVVCP